MTVSPQARATTTNLVRGLCEQQLVPEVGIRSRCLCYWLASVDPLAEATERQGTARSRRVSGPGPRSRVAQRPVKRHLHSDVSLG